MQESSSSGRPSPLLVLIKKHALLSGILAVTFLLYIRVAGYDFVWDDQYFIVENPAVQSLEYLPDYFADISANSVPYKAADFRVYRPLRNLSYLLDYSLFGLDPSGWHVHNLLLHLLNGGLVYALFQALGGKKTGAIFAASVFLAHPLQTEVVAWVKGRDDLLAVTFSLLGALIVLRPRKAGLLGGSHALACLAKVQSVAVLPAFMWFKPRADRRTRLTALGLLGVSVLYLTIRHLVLGGSEQTAYLAGGFFATFLQMGPALLRYLRLFLLPIHQLADYIHLLEHPASRVFALAAWGILAALIASFICTSRKNPALLLCGVWVATAMLPVMNIVPMMQYMAERFLYLPMVGMCLIAGIAMEALQRKSFRTGIAVACTIVVALGLLTHLRLPVWKNEVSLFSSIVEDMPMPHFRPRRNLLTALIQEQRTEEADGLSRELLAEEWPPAQRSSLLLLRSRVLKDQKQPPEKILPLLEESISLDPANAQALADLGILSAIMGDPERAVTLLTRAIKLNSDHAGFYGNRGLAYRALGQVSQAESDLRESLSITPLPQSVLGLGSLLWSQQRFQEAVAVYEEGLRYFPANAQMLQGKAGATELARRQGLEGE